MTISVANPDCGRWKPMFDRSKSPETYLRHDDGRIIVEKLNNHRVVALQGEMGSGKSSAMHAARQLLLKRGFSVTFFNGHFFGTPNEALDKLQQAINFPERRSDDKHGGQVILVDSADYLYRCKRVARRNRSQYPALMRGIIRWLSDYMELHPEVKMLLTTHDENWNKILADPELMGLFKKAFMSEAFVHVLPETVGQEALKRFIATTTEADEEDIDFMLTLLSPESEEVRDGLTRISVPDSTYDYRQLLRNPRVMGHLLVKCPTLLAEVKRIRACQDARSQFVEKALRAVVLLDLQSVFLPVMRHHVRQNSITTVFGEHHILPGF